jgi:RDD family
VAVEDSVAMPNAITGKALRDSFWPDIGALTLGLLRAQDNSIRLGPVELLRFGPAKVTSSSVQWPIEGGLLARSPGGRLRFEVVYGRLVASLEGYQPMIPRPLYTLTQLPIHHLWTRLHLLRVRGRQPSPGPPVDRSKRIAAAAIDAGICLGLAIAARRRRRIPALLGIAAGYHVACWSLSGLTLGGAVMKQRVVAVDGSKVSLGQAMVRLALLPLAAVRLRNVHDEIAGTDVITN